MSGWFCVGLLRAFLSLSPPGDRALSGRADASWRGRDDLQIIQDSLQGSHDRLSLSENQLELSAEDPELGNASETLDVEYSGDSLTIGFNARYILDVLSHIQDDGIAFSLSDDLSPGIIKPIEESGFLAVVMPMRI